MANSEKQATRCRRRLTQWSLRSICAVIVLAAVVSWWVRNELVNERRRRELVAASSEPAAKLTLSRSRAKGAVVTSWNRVLASHLLGDQPAGPIEMLTLKPGHRADEALEVFALFPETNRVYVDRVDIDPRLYASLRRLKPRLDALPLNTDPLTFQAAMRNESQVTIQLAGSAEVDELLVTLASERIPVTQVMNWDAEKASRRGCAAAGTIPTLYKAKFTDVDDVSMESFRGHQCVQDVVLLRSPDCGDATAEVISTMPLVCQMHLDGTSIGDAGFSKLGRLQYLSSFKWSGAPISARGLSLLGSKKKIHFLTVASPSLRDEHLAVMSDWPLVDLELVGGKFSADGMANLARLQMQTFSLKGCMVDTDAMQELGRSLTTVSGLELESPTINDDGVKWISKKANLQVLSLRDSGITKITIDRLAACQGLMFLTVGGNNFDSSCLAAIGKLRRLETLILIGPNFNDQTLATSSSVSVKELFLEDTAVTTDAIPHWLANWPKLEIVHVHRRGMPTSISPDDVLKATEAYPGVVFPQERKQDWAKTLEGRRLLLDFYDSTPSLR